MRKMGPTKAETDALPPFAALTLERIEVPSTADALAAAVVMHQAFAPPPSGEGDEADPEVLLRALTLPAPTPGRIAARMRAAAADPATLATIARLRVDERSEEHTSELQSQR